jgi:hypothetical protein
MNDYFLEAQRLTALALQTAPDGEPRLPYQVRQTYLSAAQVYASLAEAHAQGAMVGRLGQVIRVWEEMAGDEPLSSPPAAHPVRHAAEHVADQQPDSSCICTHHQAAHEHDTGTCLFRCGCEAYRARHPEVGQPIRFATQPSAVMS